MRGIGVQMAYNARHPRWTWWLGIVIESVIRFYFEWPRHRTLDTQLEALAAGEHLLVTAFALPAGELWHQGILELSREAVVFYRIGLLPRPVARWEAGVWRTRTRTPRKGDALYVRFGWPRTTVIECEGDVDAFLLASTRIDLNLIEAVLQDQDEKPELQVDASDSS